MGIHGCRIRQTERVARGQLSASAFALLLCLCGCGDERAGYPEIPEELIPVRGTVTLDGKPLSGALVLFLPPEEKIPWREAKAITDADGKYELIYFKEVKGTVSGLHTVRITCPDPQDIERQIVPKQYNVETTLQEDVSADHNVIDFNLKSN